MPDPEVERVLLSLFGGSKKSSNPHTPTEPRGSTAPAPVPAERPAANSIYNSSSYSAHGPNQNPPDQNQPFSPTTHTQNQSQNQSPKIKSQPGSASGNYVPYIPRHKSEGTKRRKGNPSKSCEECRRKKTKCDREVPCDACKRCRRGLDGCIYLTEEESEEREFIYYGTSGFGSGNVSPDVGEGVRPDFGASLKSEVARGGGGRGVKSDGVGTFSSGGDLSSKGNGQYGTPVRGNGLPPPPLVTAPSNVPVRLLGTIDFDGSKSKYVSSSDRMALMNQFEVAKNFLASSATSLDTQSIMHELAKFQKGFSPKYEPQFLPSHRDTLIAEMLSALPQGLSSTIRQDYLTNWETVTRILHIGTFVKDWNDLAAIQQYGGQSLPPGSNEWILPQILAVVSIVSHLHNPEDNTPYDRQLFKGQIAQNIDLIQRWLNQCTGKLHRDIHTLRTHVLLLLARQLHQTPPSELWQESSAIVRSAMLMGLHQDPEGLLTMSKFEKEQRRKLWTTITELDIQFSLAVRMPTSIPPTMFQLLGPLNVDDNDLCESKQQYPRPRPETVWTNSLPQVGLQASIHTRLSVTNLLASHINLSRDIPTLLTYASKLEEDLTLLPSLLRPHQQATKKSVSQLFAALRLDMAIRTHLLNIYHLIHISPLSAVYPSSRQKLLSNALTIISHLQTLNPSNTSPTLIPNRSHLNLFHTLHHPSILLSFLSLSSEIQALNTYSPPLMIDNPILGGKTPHNKATLLGAAEEVVHGVLHSVGGNNWDLKDVVVLSVVFQFVRGDGEADYKRMMMVRGLERVVDVCRKVGRVGSGNDDVDIDAEGEREGEDLDFEGLGFGNWD